MKPPAKRNGRTKQEHLRRVNSRRKFDHDAFGDPYGGGRPAGSGTKDEIVRQWREEHPDGTKMECHRETGLSRTTIDKWWAA